MSVTPNYQFDVYITKQMNGTGWKATISKSSFPALQFLDKTAHLNEDKYKNSFSAFLLLCDTLPSRLFDYSVATEGDNIVITGLTETTVRVAIVDLVNSVVSGASVKMVKPPTNFRVYVPEKSTVENVDGLADIGCFFDNGDY
jgi:hypothetical protein